MPGVRRADSKFTLFTFFVHLLSSFLTDLRWNLSAAPESLHTLL
uniref:Uncharacterized protein n=1 Tax=Physcomitrium patens TaxID=3218 RepID=A0A2K1KC12_PHYPA|nr:hypothetical protein PHYPA_010512 [Physcomitrium patens]